MARKNKNKRTRTVSERADYRQGGSVSRTQYANGNVVDENFVPPKPEGLDPTFGAVPKDEKTGLPLPGAAVGTPDPSFGAVPKDSLPPKNIDTSGFKTSSMVGDDIIIGQDPIEPVPQPGPVGSQPSPIDIITDPTPTPAPTPQPTPAPEETDEEKLKDKLEETAYADVTIPDVVQVGFQTDPEGNFILDNEGNPIPLKNQKVTPMADPTAVIYEKTKPVPDEIVKTVDAIIKADLPAEEKASLIEDLVKVSEDVALKIATGTINREDLANTITVARVEAIEGVKVEIEEGALTDRVIGSISPEAKAEAVKNAGTTLARVTRAKKQLRNAGLSEEDIMELGNDPEALEDRLTDFTEEQRGVIAGLPEEALVSNQLDSLLEGIEEGEIPSWAKPAVASVEAMLAQRGLSVSTIAREDLLNSIIQSALPLAQSNAQAIQTSVTQQRGIEAQAAEADAQRRQQVALTNASNVFQMDMAQFSADQQTALSNSKFLQTVSLTNATNKQQATIQNALLTSQANLAEANFAQQAQIQNANAFLQMNMQNLSNEQQAYMIEAQQEQQRILSNQAAENAAKQFNAASENEMLKFYESLTAQVDQFNATQENATSQFNVSQQNAAEARDAQREAELNKFNSQLKAQIAQHNSNQDFAQNQFNAQNAAFVENANINYMRQTNTANTAAQNAVNFQNAMNAFNMSQTSMAFMVQELRDKTDYAFRASENEKNRIAQLVNTALASDPDKYGSSTMNIQNLIKLISGDTGG